MAMGGSAGGAGTAPGGGSCLHPDHAKNALPSAATLTKPRVHAIHPPAPSASAESRSLFRGSACPAPFERAREVARTGLFGGFGMALGRTRVARSSLLVPAS